MSTSESLRKSLEQDADLPSYESEGYREQLPFWEFVSDMYEGRSAWYSIETMGSGFSVATDTFKASVYLPPETAEPTEEYSKRLARSYFDRKFADAIDSSAGFLSRFTLNEDVHPSITENIDNIDLCGNNLEVFLKAADIKSLRDDHCFVMVEFPKKDESLKDALSASKANRHPYFVLIDARDVINWDTEVKGNKIVISQVTIREITTQKLGRFGTKKVLRYRVLTPGGYELYEVTKGDKQDDFLLIEEGQTTLDFIPLIPYCLMPRDSDYFVGKPPFYDIAELNLKLYQKQSEKDEAMHKANMAILSIQPMETGAGTGKHRLGGKGNKDDDENTTPIIRIGPNTCLMNVKASFVEPSGSALSQTQADIDKLELTILSKTLAFQSGFAAPPTATEVDRVSATAQATLASMARAKESVVQQMLRVWALYMNAPDKGGTISVNKKIIEQGMDSIRAELLLNMRLAGELTRGSFLELFKKGDILDKGFDIDAEVEELENQKKAEMQSQIDEVKNQFDLANQAIKEVDDSFDDKNVNELPQVPRRRRQKNIPNPA